MGWVCTASVWYSMPMVQCISKKEGVGCCPMITISGHPPFLASTKCVMGELRSADSCTAEFSYFQRIAYPDWYVLLSSPDFLIMKIFVSEFPRFIP